MTPQHQTALQHPCRHPLEMAHPRYQRTQTLDHVCYRTTVTIHWGGAVFPRQPVWHAQVTVLGPQGALPLAGLPAPVRQRARQLAAQALAGVGTATRHVLETVGAVLLYVPLTETACARLPSGWAGHRSANDTLSL